VRAILELAENYSKEPLQFKTIAEHQQISAEYLKQLTVMPKSTVQEKKYIEANTTKE